MTTSSSWAAIRCSAHVCSRSSARNSGRRFRSACCSRRRRCASSRNICARRRRSTAAPVSSRSRRLPRGRPFSRWEASAATCSDSPTSPARWGPSRASTRSNPSASTASREPLVSIEAMAQLYLSEMRSVQPRGPYALIGACFGATVAYEMARRLAESGEEVAFLGLLDPTRVGGEDAGRPIAHVAPARSVGRRRPADSSRRVSNSTAASCMSSARASASSTSAASCACCCAG